MEIKYTDRTQLKEYFRKNKIPKETDFSEFIDASLNQREDGLVKMPGDPLSIEAVGEKTSVQRLMNFYRKLSDPAPTWSVNLNDQNAGGSLLPGLSIISQGKGRLFIDEASGRVGLATSEPQKQLHIENGELRVRASHNNLTSDLATFYAKDLTQGIGIGNNRIEAVGANPDQDIIIIPKGTGLIRLNNSVYFGEGIKQMIHLWKKNYGIGVQGGTLYNRSDKNFSWFIGGTHADGELDPGTGGRAAMVLKDGLLGIGADPQKKLHVENGELRVRAGHNTETADIGAFCSQDLTQGIGIGRNRIEAIGNNPNQDIFLVPKGSGGMIRLSGNVSATNSISFCMQMRQMINLWDSTYGLGIQGSTLYQRSAVNFSWHIGGTHADGELDPGPGGRAAMVLKNGLLGIGTQGPQRKLHVESGELRVRSSHDLPTADIGTFYANNLTQGIGIGFNSIEAIGSNPNQDIRINPKGNGVIWVGGRTPLTFTRYVLNQGTVDFNTTVNASEYTAAIVGFIAAGGDIDEGEADNRDVMRVRVYIKNNVWWVNASFKTQFVRERWTIDVMFAANALCSRQGY
jgi:hypothetical protein